MGSTPRIEVVRRSIARDALRRPNGLTAGGAAFKAAPGDGGPYGDPTVDGGWNHELPATGIELVIELDGRWDLEIDGKPCETGAFAAGLVAGPARTRARGAVRLVQLTIDPLAAPALFGVPAGEFAATAIDLGDLLGRGADELLTRLDDAFVAGDPVAVAEAWVRDRTEGAEAGPGPCVPADVHLACALMRASGGTLRTQAVAHELGCSRRHLARRFAEFVGVPPSAYARLLRFERATHALRRDQVQPLGRLAAEMGYADHAHMDRDFRILAGATPTAVAARFAA